MVVLLSRARVAMYLVGNGSYFSPENSKLPEHWADVIKALCSPSQSDTFVGEDEEQVTTHFNGARLGPNLPLCCPIHRPLSLTMVKAGEKVTVKCSKVCDHELSCGHECSLPCHYGTPKSHQQACKVLFDSPCADHPMKIECSQLQAESLKSFGFFFSAFNPEAALLKYRCKVTVAVDLPCGHSNTFTCAKERDFALKMEPWPDCKMKALTSITLPCKHEMKDVKCFEYDKKLQTVDSYLCKVEDHFTAECGHTKMVKCYLIQQYHSKTTVFRCAQQVPISLPRCFHEKVMGCSEARGLENWNGKSVEEKGVVKEGVAYGPLDHRCEEQVQFQRKCGHVQKKKCTDAFNLSLSQSAPCHEFVELEKLSCGHSISVDCHLKEKYEALKGNASRLELPVAKVVEGSMTGFAADPINSPTIPCNRPVEVTRLCGHMIQIECDIARAVSEGSGAVLPQCEAPVKVPNPLCFHLMEVPCFLKKAVEEWDPWPQDFLSSDLYKKDVLSHDISPPDQKPPQRISKLFKKMEV